MAETITLERIYLVALRAPVQVLDLDLKIRGTYLKADTVILKYFITSMLPFDDVFVYYVSYYAWYEHRILVSVVYKLMCQVRD